MQIVSIRELATQGSIAATVILGMFLALPGCSQGAPGNDEPAETRVPSGTVESLEEPATTPDDEPLASPRVDDILPEEFQRLWHTWTGDLNGMIERRAIRVLVPFGGYQFYYDHGQPRGAIVELLQRMEVFLNDELQRRHIKVYVAAIPVSRDHLIPYLLEGHGDLIAGDLTVTDDRKHQLNFSRPLLKDVNEIVVTGPTAPDLNEIDDLAGQEIVVRASSSYFEHLQLLAADFRARGLEPPVISLSDELLEAEDLLEMTSAGLIPMTILDDYKARFWSSVFPDITVREDLSINNDGVIAWAMLPESKDLAAFVERFLRKNGRGTLVGNDTFNRHLANASHVRCSMTASSLAKRAALVSWLKMYAEEFDFDWLMLAAQGYQESRLIQSKKSAAGAIGVMQIKPETAADKNVNVPDITILENNIHAGAKYMRFLADRYFSDRMDELNRWLFSLAAYNAGPARVAGLRKEASENGLDPDRWFGNVEIIAARRIGSETVGYVSSIYKYFIGYKMSEARSIEKHRRHADELTECDDQ